MGGRYVLGGNALLRKHQAAFDPTIVWVGKRVREIEPDYFGNTTYVSGFEEQRDVGSAEPVDRLLGVSDEEQSTLGSGRLASLCASVSIPQGDGAP